MLLIDGKVSHLLKIFAAVLRFYLLNTYMTNAWISLTDSISPLDTWELPLVRDISKNTAASGTAPICSPSNLICLVWTNKQTYNQIGLGCVDFDKICDGVKDCVTGEDESRCQ